MALPVLSRPKGIRPLVLQPCCVMSCLWRSVPALWLACPTRCIGYNHCKRPAIPMCVGTGREAIQDAEGAAKRHRRGPARKCRWTGPDKGAMSWIQSSRWYRTGPFLTSCAISRWPS